MKCRFPNCHREARKGNTMCNRHYSAGDTTVNDMRKRMERQRREREALKNIATTPEDWKPLRDAEIAIRNARK